MPFLPCFFRDSVWGGLWPADRDWWADISERAGGQRWKAKIPSKWVLQGCLCEGLLAAASALKGISVGMRSKVMPGVLHVESELVRSIEGPTPRLDIRNAQGNMERRS